MVRHVLRELSLSSYYNCNTSKLFLCAGAEKVLRVENEYLVHIDEHQCEARNKLNRKYHENVIILKALADTNRLSIVDMLSCGELCACEILEKFTITQPTLSHHMKILCDCRLVHGRKDGKWTYYALNEKVLQNFREFISEVLSCKENCICVEKSCCEEVCCE